MMEDKKYYGEDEDWKGEDDSNTKRYPDILPEDYTPELDDWWIPLRDMLNKLPKNMVLVVDPKRYAEANKSIGIIKSAVDEEIENVKYEIKYDDLLGTSLDFVIHTKYVFGIRDTKAFAEAIKNVDVIGISANLNEEIEIAFSYYGVRVPILPPATE